LRRRAVLSVAGVVLALGGQAAFASLALAGSSPSAYVVNIYDGTVTPIAIATNTPGAPIPVGSQNEDVAIAVTPDGKTAYVANAPTTYGNGTLTPIDLATGTAGTPIAAGLAPDALAITPDGKTIYVANGPNGASAPSSATGVTPIGTATY
jgi:DNA-binding beta-propeller fold protein YncE